MKIFLVNLLFAFIWMMVSGSFTLLSMMFGFVIGAAALIIITERSELGGYGTRFRRVIGLILMFLYELMMSAIRVAIMVLKPDMNLKPGIFSYQTELKSDLEITLLANLITLTPGTLSVDVDEETKTLYIHGVDCSDVEATRADIRNGFERKIREVFE